MRVGSCVVAVFLVGPVVSDDRWPQTCDAAFSNLIEPLADADKQTLAGHDQGEIILPHDGFGTGIKNRFGLWAGNTALIEDCAGDPDAHPDTASAIIINELVQRLKR